MKCHKEDAPLLGLMGQSMRLIGKRAQELYAEYDLNRAQSGILFALHQEDSMSQKELAKRLNVTPPSITSMIKKMEQEGYITRKADEQIRRHRKEIQKSAAKRGIDIVRDRDARAEQEQHRQQQIRHRPRQRCDGHALLRLFEIPHVDRHGLCPAEADEQHRGQTEPVDMVQRI